MERKEEDAIIPVYRNGEVVAHTPKGNKLTWFKMVDEEVKPADIFPPDLHLVALTSGPESQEIVEWHAVSKDELDRWAKINNIAENMKK